MYSSIHDGRVSSFYFGYVGLSKIATDSSQVHRFPRVLQGQEMRTFGGSLGDGEMESAQNPMV